MFESSYHLCGAIALFPKITKGYWETIILSWDIQPKGFEVEVFGDRLELYRFDDRRTDIKNVAHRAGEAFPTTLLAELPKAST
jgi:hypothetical protein